MILDELSEGAHSPTPVPALETQPFDLVELVEGVLLPLAPRLADRALHAAAFVAPELRTGAFGDPARLGRVLGCLAADAAETAAPGGFTLEALAVGAPQPQGGATRRVRFRLRANGIGGAGAPPRHAGCRDLAALMGGTLGADPAMPGLWLELPLPAAPTVRRWRLAPAAAGTRLLVAGGGLAPSPPGEGGAADLWRQLAALALDPVAASDLSDALAALERARQEGAPYRILFLDLSDGTAPPELRPEALGETRVIAVPAAGVAAVPGWAAATLPRPIALERLIACLNRHAAPPAAAALPAAVAGAAAPAEAAAEIRDAPLRVLLVEDNEMNLRVLQAFLSRPAYRTAIAHSGREAVAAAAAAEFDVVLMDLRMPDMDGAEATRRIRGLPAPWRDVHVIAVTADATGDAEQRCRDAGMNDYLAKPVALAVLEAKLDALRRRPRGCGTATAPAAPTASSPAGTARSRGSRSAGP